MDLKYLSDEYLKLTSYTYSFGIDNGEKLDISFDKKGFYHLLGFEKFTDVTVVKMVEFGVLRKNQFFQEIQKENITYEHSNVKNIDKFINGDIINFCDAKRTDKVKRVLSDRLPYFSYRQITELFESDLIILYDPDKGLDNCKVDADKIFFKLLKPEYKNLYLFVKDDAESPLSFFKEEKQNLYIKTKPGEAEKQQKKASIIYKSIWDKKENKLVNFEIYWEKVRFYYSRNNSANYKAQLNMEKCFGKNAAVRSTDVEIRMLENADKIRDYADKITKRELIKTYLDDPGSEEGIGSAINLLDNYGYDIEKEAPNIDLGKLQSKINKLKNEISHYKKENKRLRKYLPMLYDLEKEEIICVYKNFYKKIESLEDEFIVKLINDHRIFENMYLPDQIKGFYKIQK